MDDGLRAAAPGGAAAGLRDAGGAAAAGGRPFEERLAARGIARTTTLLARQDVYEVHIAFTVVSVMVATCRA